jgi:hypothetical protein
MLILVSVAMRNVWVEVRSFDDTMKLYKVSQPILTNITFDSKERIEAIQPTLF